MTTRKDAVTLSTAPTFADGPLSSSQSVSASAPSLLMTPEEVLAVTGYKNVATLYDLVKKAGFPAPISLGPRRANGSAGKAMWVRDEVMDYLMAKIAEPRPLAIKHRKEQA